jgi:hypothetical protein
MYVRKQYDSGSGQCPHAGRSSLTSLGSCVSIWMSSLIGTFDSA